MNAKEIYEALSNSPKSLAKSIYEYAKGMEEQLTATQAQASMQEALEKIADMAPDEGGHQYVALVALAATADNEQAVNRIKAQALRELIERYPFFKDREVEWLLGSIEKDIDELDGGGK